MFPLSDHDLQRNILKKMRAIRTPIYKATISMTNEKVAKTQKKNFCFGKYISLSSSIGDLQILPLKALHST